MQFQVTDIEFDFDDAIFRLNPFEEEEVIDETKATIWEADDGDDLIEEITCATGWCIKSIDYRIILDDIDVPECETAFDINYTTQA